MGLYHAALDTLRMASLLAGSLIIFAGIERATIEARGAGGRGRVARQITDHAALGLEFFIASTILNLILNPTWIAVATTAITIALRQIITFSLGLTRGASG